MSRPTEIIIDLDALRSNCRYAQSLAPDSRVVAVVKADAYGHGAAEIALALEGQAFIFAVSCMEEALSLRKGGVKSPILMLEGCFSADEYQQAVEHDIHLVVHNDAQIAMLEQASLSLPLTIWLKIDTGMHRLGIAPQLAVESYHRLMKTGKARKIILTTHLSSADLLEAPHTQNQLTVFDQAIGPLKSGPDPAPACSIANSAGLMAWPSSHAEWVRPGIMLYGVSPFEQHLAMSDALTPVMTFTSKVIAVRDVAVGESVGYGNTWTANRASRIATVAAGYGDGYPRTAKSGTPVLVNGLKARLAGRVSMDMICVDVTDVGPVNIDDPVEFWGKNLLVNEVAKWADTIGYELVTRMPKRTRRLYTQ